MNSCSASHRPVWPNAPASRPNIFSRHTSKKTNSRRKAKSDRTGCTTPSSIAENTLNETRDDFDPIFPPWHAFAALPATEFQAKAKELAKKFARNEDEDDRLHPLVAKTLEGEPPQSLDP